MDEKEQLNQEEQPLNRKDITETITGKPINFDEMGWDEEEDENAQEQPQEDVLNPLVGVMDLLITTTPPMLQKRGYPKPNLDIWEEWGKPNLSKALNAYMPAGTAAGNVVSSPAFAGLIGIAALAIAFMPVILHYIDKKKAEKEAEMKALDEQFAVENSPYDEEQDQPEPEPTKPNIRPENKEAWNRINDLIASQKQAA